MRSTLARRIFTTTLAVVIVGPLTSGFTINRSDSPHRKAADQTSQESVQLQAKDISRRSNDINDGKNGSTIKATPTRTISWNETGHLKKESDVPKVGVELQVEDIFRKPNNINDGKNEITTKGTPFRTLSWNETGHLEKESVSKVGIQLQDEDISRRSKDINEGKNDVTSKTAPVSTISRNETGHQETESDILKVTVTDIILQPNFTKLPTENDNETTPPKLNTTRNTEEQNTVTTSASISQITQPVTITSLKEDGSNMTKTTTKEGTTLNINQMTTDSETNADLSTRKDSASSKSKTDITTYKSKMIKDDVVSETTPELTTTEEIVFRNSKTPEMVVNKEISQIEDTSTVDTFSTVTTVPSWKKYVTIDRKRTNEETTTEIVDRDQKPSAISQNIEEVPLELSVWLPKNDSIPSTDTNLQLTTIENKSTENEGILTTSGVENISLKNNDSTPSTDTNLQPKIIENKSIEKEGIVTTSSVVDNISLKNNNDSITSTDTNSQFTTIESKSIEKDGIVTTSDVDKIGLKNNDSIPSTDTDLQLTTIENKSMEKERIVSSSNADDIRLKNISTVDTKRGGFLDLSKTSSSEPSFTTKKNTVNLEEQVTISEPLSTKKPSVAKSQSQLTEDAINEELLKEEMIINHEENIIRHQKVQQADGENQIMEVAPVVKESQSTEEDDNLSVQPISQDRKTTLYTVSPNYKPMKKIDVQPPKPLVRDPDDNSWRNESINSLGIVFKPKNSTKSFKQVLKNKTETEFFNISENKDSKNELPHLRSRLEKIAEVRKSKKKKTNKSGEEIYTDYEGNSSEEASTSTTTARIDNMVFDLFNYKSTTLSTTTPMPFIKLETETTREKNSNDLFKKFDFDINTTYKPKKHFKSAEYYDATDEYDADYVTLPKIDLKKFTRPYTTTVTPLTQSVTSWYTTKSMSRSQSPERKATVQYFPPRKPPTTVQKVNVDHYDDEFQKKVNSYTSTDKVHSKDFFSFTNLNDPIATEKPTTIPSSQFEYTSGVPGMTTESIYSTTRSRLSSPHGFVLNDENFNRGSYVIKHYRDFLNDAAKASEFDKISEFVYPDNPEKVNGLTTLLVTGSTPPKKAATNYNYESEFHKDVLDRFVENFNQNSERFKIDFPILYNNSIVHQKFDDDGRVASSTAFLKRQYGNEGVTKSSPFSNTRKSCDPNCENNMMVELSPAYELHYFVPEQEERASPPPGETPPPPAPPSAYFKL